MLVSRVSRLVTLFLAFGVLSLAMPVFAESMTATTSVTLTVQDASPSPGGGWNYRLPSAIFPSTRPIVMEFSPLAYTGSGLPIQSPASAIPAAAPAPEKLDTTHHPSGVSSAPTPLLSETSTQEQSATTSGAPDTSSGVAGSHGALPHLSDTLTKALTHLLDQKEKMISWIVGPWKTATPPHEDVRATDDATRAPIRGTGIGSDPIATWNLVMQMMLILLTIGSLVVMFLRKVSRPWHTFNMFILLSICSYGGIVVLEYVGATTTVVSFTVSNLSLSCGSSLSLGVIPVTGDTGAYASERKVSCLIEAGTPDGYTLQWKSQPQSGGTATGSLRNQNGDTIGAYTPAVSGTPEIWSVSANVSEWGGRVSSTSTTVSTALWGTDGSSEKWLNVSTAGATIVSRSSATSSGSPDTENIGLRAEIGPQALQPGGTYQAAILFTAVAN